MKAETIKSCFLPASIRLYELSPIVLVPVFQFFCKAAFYVIYLTQLCEDRFFVKTAGNFWEKMCCNHDIL